MTVLTIITQLLTFLRFSYKWWLSNTSALENHVDEHPMTCSHKARWCYPLCARVHLRRVVSYSLGDNMSPFVNTPVIVHPRVFPIGCVHVFDLNWDSYSIVVYRSLSFPHIFMVASNGTRAMGWYSWKIWVNRTVINHANYNRAWNIHRYLLHVFSHTQSGCGNISTIVNTLRSRQNGRRFADDTFKSIVLNENVRISIESSLKFVPKGPINYNPALVQIMAWRRSGDKPLSEPMMVCFLTHICVTRRQWVNSTYTMRT